MSIPGEEATGLEKDGGPHSKLQPIATQDSKPAVRTRKPGRNFAMIHCRPLPVLVYPLPFFHPTQPLSMLHLLFAYVSQILTPKGIQPDNTCSGVYLPQARAVHVANSMHMRMLWEMGFFGKGILSRSEPNWMERESSRRVFNHARGTTAEEARDVRREERKLFKLERARAERDRIERQKLLEQQHARPAGSTLGSNSLATNVHNAQPTAISEEQIAARGHLATNTEAPAGMTIPTAELTRQHVTNHSRKASPLSGRDMQRGMNEPIKNEEHLQLTLEEAFFLAFGIGCLKIYPYMVPDDQALDTITAYTTGELFNTFTSAYEAVTTPNRRVSPDNTFLLKYVAYHYFRSLGWVVRPGIKFSVDYLLYNRGPVFSHAEFAVIVIPAYTHAFWETEAGKRQRNTSESRDWWWLHCINRVQSQVRKSLVIVYVDIPPVMNIDDIKLDVLVGRYRIREFVVRRWQANRSRD